MIALIDCFVMRDIRASDVIRAPSGRSHSGWMPAERAERAELRRPRATR